MKLVGVKIVIPLGSSFNNSVGVQPRLNEVKASGKDIRFKRKFAQASEGIIWAQIRRGAFDQGRN